MKEENPKELSFFTVCENCMGENTYVRMLKQNYKRNCYICNKPMISYKWQPGKNSKSKFTIICKSCADYKNVCQVCLYDLKYGLPVHVRESILSSKHSNHQNKLEINNDQIDKYNANIQLLDNNSDTKTNLYAEEIFKSIQNTKVNYKRNAKKVCTFWLQGKCKDGEFCAFRHENTNVIPNNRIENIRKRYFGESTNTSEKILNKLYNAAKVSKNNEKKNFFKSVEIFDPNKL